MGNYDTYIVDGTPLSALSTAVKAIMCPIGGIIAWAKTMTSVPGTLPDGYVECDGSVLSDADSPFNGQTIPDLNGGEFLRGSTTSGTAGGAQAWNHGHTVILNPAVATSGARQISCSAAYGTNVADVRPPFYDVVFIMRIK